MAQRVDRADLLFVRMSALPTGSLDAFIEALGRWPELRVVKLIRVDDAPAEERLRMARYFDVQGAVADRVGAVWGWDDGGELRRTMRPTGQPGLWLQLGGVPQARTYSKFLALQIVAELRGLK